MQENDDLKELWEMEGKRLKQLREENQMTRKELAILMATSETRLARLEHGKGVRDARTLSAFYEFIFKYKNLVRKFDELKNVRENQQKIQVISIEKNHLESQKVKNTRLSKQKIIYI